MNRVFNTATPPGEHFAGLIDRLIDELNRKFDNKLSNYKTKISFRIKNRDMNQKLIPEL